MINSCKLKFLNIPSSNEIDADVLEEKERVNEIISTRDFAANNLILQNLTHFYGRFVAVNKLSVAIEPYECFGLLGVNGAGKTTTIEMLIGEKYMSDGDAWVCGISIKSYLSTVRKLIGYCPQFDALLENLTGRENSMVFAMLRGMRHTDIASISASIATKYDFIDYIDTLVSKYSGGNRRKLCTSIAFLGNASVVYLDEPTAGLDPEAKRRIWNVINQERSSGRTIVLTTHSMDECEALCTRVAIMDRGELKCLGTMQYLKNKFSKGYELKIKVKEVTDRRLVCILKKL